MKKSDSDFVFWFFHRRGLKYVQTRDFLRARLQHRDFNHYSSIKSLGSCLEDIDLLCLKYPKMYKLSDFIIFRMNKWDAYAECADRYEAKIQMMRTFG